MKDLKNLFSKKNKVKSADSEFENYFDSNNVINEGDVPNVNKMPVKNAKENAVIENDNAINQLMLYTLGPELRGNEMQKRNFKQRLMGYVQIILSGQLIVVGIVFILVCCSVCFGVKSSLLRENINSIFSFLQYYITAIIVELIAMLFFIVKFVFDKSIVDLLSDTINKDKKSESKKKYK